MKVWKYVLLGHLAHTRGRARGLGVIERIHDLDRGSEGAAVVHLVRNIVEMEEVVHEVAAHPQLGVAGEGVAHRGEITSLQPMERVALLLAEVTSAEKPSLRLYAGEFPVTVTPNGDSAVRDEVGNDDLRRGRRRRRGK